MNRKMTRRKFVKLAGAAVAMAALPGCATFAADAVEKDKGAKEQVGKAKVAGTGGEHYIPYSERQGAESVVYFTRDLSAAGLLKLYDRVKDNLGGKVAIKLHTGEPHGPNIIAPLSKPTPIMAAGVTPRKSTGRRCRPTAGLISLLWISLMLTAQPCCLCPMASGSQKCLWARIC